MWVAAVPDAVWVVFVPTRAGAVLSGHFGVLLDRPVVADGLRAYKSHFPPPTTVLDAHPGHGRGGRRGRCRRRGGVKIRPGHEFYHMMCGIKTLSPFTMTPDTQAPRHDIGVPGQQAEDALAQRGLRPAHAPGVQGDAAPKQPGRTCHPR